MLIEVTSLSGKSTGEEARQRKRQEFCRDEGKKRTGLTEAKQRIRVREKEEFHCCQDFSSSKQYSIAEFHQQQDTQQQQQLQDRIKQIRRVNANSGAILKVVTLDTSLELYATISRHTPTHFLLLKEKHHQHSFQASSYFSPHLPTPQLHHLI